MEHGWTLLGERPRQRRQPPGKIAVGDPGNRPYRHSCCLGTPDQLLQAGSGMVKQHRPPPIAIKAGEQIAEMGSSASARDELHFEIRKNGKPVNLIDYLPPR